MTYRIIHKTTYKYEQPVSFGTHVAYLTPRSQPYQACTWHELLVTPAPVAMSERMDYFGNCFTFFTIQEPHEELKIEARSGVVADGPSVKWPERSPAWDEVVRSLPADLSADGLNAYQFVFESPRVPLGAEFAAYASQSFSPARPLAEALLDFTGRIYKDFRFDSKATNVRTSPVEVLRSRRGVCQDFAHLQVACLRSLGLPARYVSGYIRTYPPPGGLRLIGADASHAWISAYCPGTGWLDVDPTNNLIPSESHVTLAWGRDYGDVSPVRGVILGGRDHKLEVGVDMEPLDLKDDAGI
jgi:transglutaminase-like putative cysteine protease